jgi:hypothetical protein
MLEYGKLFDTQSSSGDTGRGINGFKEGPRIKASSMSKTVGNTIGRNNIYYKHIDKAQARYSDREYQSKKHTLFDIEQ